MAIDTSTFNLAGGAVSDLFQGLGAETTASLKAQGLDIEAQSTQLSAEGLRIKAEGDIAEASNYDLAASLARQNEQYTIQSTAIQQMQLDRQITMTIGGQQADVAGSGLKESGNALDLLRDSAAQGALAKNVLAQQGVITEAGYDEQAKSYDTMAAAGRSAAAGEMDIASKTDVIAQQQQKLAQDTLTAGQDAAVGDFVMGAVKAVAGIATLGMGGPAVAAAGAAASAAGGPAGNFT